MERTWKPTTAGILAIVAGIIIIVIGAIVAATGTFGVFAAMIPFAALAGVGGGLIAAGAVALIGGIFALRRCCWGVALAGAICATVSPPAASVLGVLAIIFVVLGRREFA